MQEKLHDVLLSGIVRPVGTSYGFKVDTRLLCSTDIPIEQLIASGKFRPVLFALLAPTRIQLPPLRERAGDIPALARHFLARIGEQPGLRHLSISEGALALLGGYDWPGNVRKLQAVLFRAAVHCDAQTLTAESFPQLSELLGEPVSWAPALHDGVGVMLYTEDGNQIGSAHV